MVLVPFFSADTQRKSVGLAPNIWWWKRLVSRNVEEFRLIGSNHLVRMNS